jgi:integrase
MPKRRRLTDDEIPKLPRKTKRYTLADPELIGHYLRVPARKSKAPITFVAVARQGGKQLWTTLGTANTLGLAQARELARDVIGRVRSGKPATSRGGPTVADVAEKWLQRRVRARGLRTARERERIIARYILPRIGDRVFPEVRRSDLATMLDEIEDAHGPVMADAVLKVYGAISRWYHTRHEDYIVPVTKEMSRSSRVRRERILSDAEIAAIWRLNGPDADFVKLLLLTAQRKHKLTTLCWGDVKDDVWTIRTEAREKGNPGKLKLPQIVLDIIARQPRFVGNPFVFAGREGPTTAYGAGRYKKALDQGCGVKDWRIHDLRRTARSLMSRAGVQTEIAERVLGHAPGELIQIYDRHHYQGETAEALTKLAALLERIVAI